MGEHLGDGPAPSLTGVTRPLSLDESACPFRPLLAQAAHATLPESYQTRWVRAQGTRGPQSPDAGPVRARAPPLRALCQSPTRRGASLTFRYCCGSSLSCGGATGR